jgi:hypothetical protein
MAITVGGTLGVTWPDATTTSAANVTNYLGPAITDTANVMTINSKVNIDGTNGIYANGNIYTTDIFAFNLTSGTDLNLRTQALAAGWGGSSPVIATIPAANTIQSSSTGVYALTINGSFPAGVTLVNNGTIVGRGGNGGAGGPANMDTANQTAGTATAGSPGSAGGPGLLVSVAVTVNNISGRIAGGGGGSGGGGGAAYGGRGIAYTSGGGGGGGGIGASTGGSGGIGSGVNQGNTTGGVGGNGTTSVVGSAGLGVASGGTAALGGNGGVGGTFGSAGAAGTAGTTGAGVINSRTASGGAAGAAGACLAGNANITWTAFGTRDGAIT